MQGQLVVISNIQVREKDDDGNTIIQTSDRWYKSSNGYLYFQKYKDDCRPSRLVKVWKLPKETNQSNITDFYTNG